MPNVPSDVVGNLQMHPPASGIGMPKAIRWLRSLCGWWR